MPTPAPATTSPSRSPIYDSANNITGYTSTDAKGQTSYQNQSGGAATTTPQGSTAYGMAPPAAKPAPAVISAKSATDFTNNKMIPALQNGMGAIAVQNAANDRNDLTHFLPGETSEQYTQRAASVNTAKGTPSPTTPESESDKAAKQIANTPEAGNQFIYDPSGQRMEVPVGTPPPAGYTTTAPANPTLRGHTVVNSFNADSGTTYQQYSDGTYGVAGVDGIFAGTVSSDQYNQALATSPGEVLKGIANGLSSLKNGPLPLTAPQQAQIDALKANLGIAVTAQEQANSNYTGGTTVAMNLYGMGNSLSGMGLIKATVDQGIAKIFELQTKAATAIAQMQEAFDKDNMTQMYTYYQAMTSATKAIDDHITALHTFAFQQKEHADQEADNLRTFNQKVQQDAITNKREDALTRSTIATQSMERTKLSFEIKDLKNAENFTSNLPGGSVTGANGQPDPAKQQAFLQNIAKTNPGLALQVKAAAEYRLPLSSRFFSTKAGQAFTQTMLQYDPTFDATNYAAKQATVTNFSSGQYSKTVNALNTATAHIETLNKAYAGLNMGMGNSNIPAANAVRNAIGNALGVSPTAGAKLNITAVTGELAAAFKNSGATDSEIKSLGVLNENSSPAAVKTYIETASNLLAGKLGALTDTYTAGVGKPPAAPLLHPDAAAALSQLKNKGYDIQVPGVIYTDPVAFQKSDPQASQKMDAARTMLQANGMPTTPENILQAAQLDNQ